MPFVRIRPLPQALVLALLAAYPAAHAQEAPPAEARDRSKLEAVVITAERRAENINEVPSAVSAIAGERLDVLASGGQDVRFLSGRVPSLNIESSFGRAFPRFYIRGYGNTDFRLNASQPVSLIYDDVVQENPILKGFPVFDLKQVEVVAGPQGTLYGRNTPAGVVKFESMAPSLKRQEGYVNLSYGRFGTSNVEGAFNMPLGEHWAARLSLLVQHRDDWVSNRAPSVQTGKTEGYDDRAVRLQLLYQPHADFSALFNIHNRELDGSPRLFRANIIKPGSNDLVDGFDPARAEFDGVNEQRLHATGASARLKWRLGDLTLHSITALEAVQPFSRGDVDGGYGASYAPPFGPGFIPFSVETADALSDHRQLSQEFRAEVNPGGPLRYQGGVYFFDERYTVHSYNYDTVFAGPVTSAHTHQTNRAYALFGSVQYDVSPVLKLRGGLRYTHDKKTLSTSSTDVALDASNGLATDTADSKLTWDVSGTYALTKGTNLYARVGTGLRGAAILPASAFGPMSKARQETLTSYEVGIKSDFWDRRARLSATLYSYDVKGLQLTEVGGGSASNTVKSAAKARGQGVELNLELLPIDALFLTLGGSYNDAKIRDANLTVAGCGGGCTVLNRPAGNGQFYIDGNQLPQAPRWTANLTARYTWALPGGSEFYVYTDWAYRSSVNFFLYESVEFTGKAMTEGGLRLGYVFGNGQYEVAGFARNITNQLRVTGGIDFNNLTGFINDPRSYGVQFKASF